MFGGYASTLSNKQIQTNISLAIWQRITIIASSRLNGVQYE